MTAEEKLAEAQAKLAVATRALFLIRDAAGKDCVCGIHSDEALAAISSPTPNPVCSRCHFGVVLVDTEDWPKPLCNSCYEDDERGGGEDTLAVAERRLAVAMEALARWGPSCVCINPPQEMTEPCERCQVLDAISAPALAWREVEEPPSFADYVRHKNEQVELMERVAARTRVIEAAQYIGTEHSGMCATVACNCAGHAKRRVELAEALANLRELEGKAMTPKDGGQMDPTEKVMYCEHCERIDTKYSAQADEINDLKDAMSHDTDCIIEKMKEIAALKDALARHRRALEAWLAWIHPPTMREGHSAWPLVNQTNHVLGREPEDTQ